MYIIRSTPNLFNQETLHKNKVSKCRIINVILDVFISLILILGFIESTLSLNSNIEELAFKQGKDKQIQYCPNLTIKNYKCKEIK